MGEQLIGRELKFGIANETTFATVPGSPSCELAYLRTSSLGGTIAKLIDDTLSGYRGQQRPIDGAIDLMGSLQTNLAPESCGRLLKNLMGLSATTYAVAVKSTATVTGVEVLRAESASAAGNGTLAFAIAGTTLAWNENADTAGTPVNVSAGGDFILASANGKKLYVRVTASLLPAGNQSDTVAVSGATVYEHVFSVAGPKPAGMVVECDLGSKITTSRRFLRFLGCKVGQGQFAFPANGFASANYDIKGATFNRDSGVTLDATFDDYGHNAFSMRDAEITLNGAAFSKGTDCALTVNNDLDDSNYTIGGRGARESLPDGQLMVSGSLTALATDETASVLVDAINGSNASLAIVLKRGTGLGTAGNEALVFRLPELSLTPVTEKMDGAKGIRQQIEFNGYRPTGSDTRVEICLRTTRAAASF